MQNPWQSIAPLKTPIDSHPPPSTNIHEENGSSNISIAIDISLHDEADIKTAAVPFSTTKIVADTILPSIPPEQFLVYDRKATDEDLYDDDSSYEDEYDPYAD